LSLSSVMRPPAGKCPWPGYGDRTTVEVFITIPGKPPRAGSIGRYCVGRAVICGIQAQTRHRGRLWYLPVALTLAHHDPGGTELLPGAGMSQQERRGSSARALTGHD
jgi:hypothetical protein